MTLFSTVLNNHREILRRKCSVLGRLGSAAELLGLNALADELVNCAHVIEVSSDGLLREFIESNMPAGGFPGFIMQRNNEDQAAEDRLAAEEAK
jgi:hypothetical protein